MSGRPLAGRVSNRRGRSRSAGPATPWKRQSLTFMAVWAGIDEQPETGGIQPVLLVDAWQETQPCDGRHPSAEQRESLRPPFVQRHKQPYLPGMTGRPADALPGLLQQKPSPAYPARDWNPSKGENRPCWPCSMRCRRRVRRPGTGVAPSELIIFVEGSDGGSRRSPGRAPVPNHIRRRAAEAPSGKSVGGVDFNGSSTTTGPSHKYTAAKHLKRALRYGSKRSRNSHGHSWRFLLPPDAG